MNLERLQKYVLPLGAVLVCGGATFYLAKKMRDMEQQLGAIRRNNTRHLSETDVRLIVEQMIKENGVTAARQTGVPVANPHQYPQQTGVPVANPQQHIQQTGVPVANPQQQQQTPQTSVAPQLLYLQQQMQQQYAVLQAAKTQEEYTQTAQLLQQMQYMYQQYQQVAAAQQTGVPAANQHPPQQQQQPSGAAPPLAQRRQALEEQRHRQQMMYEQRQTAVPVASQHQQQQEQQQMTREQYNAAMMAQHQYSQQQTGASVAHQPHQQQQHHQQYPQQQNTERRTMRGPNEYPETSLPSVQQSQSAHVFTLHQAPTAQQHQIRVAVQHENPQQRAPNSVATPQPTQPAQPAQQVHSQPQAQAQHPKPITEDPVIRVIEDDDTGKTTLQVPVETEIHNDSVHLTAALEAPPITVTTE